MLESKQERMKMENKIQEEMGVASVSTPSGHSVDTSSVPEPAGWKKRDRRKKDDTDHMYRRNILGKAIDILKLRREQKNSLR